MCFLETWKLGSKGPLMWFSCKARCWEAVPPIWPRQALGLPAPLHPAACPPQCPGITKYQRSKLLAVVRCKGLGKGIYVRDSAIFLLGQARALSRFRCCDVWDRPLPLQQVPKKHVCNMKYKFSSIKLICKLLNIIRLQEWWLYEES